MTILKNMVKAKICIDCNYSPNYPLKDFVTWAEQFDAPQVLDCLDLIQQELDAEFQAATEQNLSLTKEQHISLGYGRMYCEQVRAYYRMVNRDPQSKNRFWFLLQ